MKQPARICLAALCALALCAPAAAEPAPPGPAPWPGSPAGAPGPAPGAAPGSPPWYGGSGGAPGQAPWNQRMTPTDGGAGTRARRPSGPLHLSDALHRRLLNEDEMYATADGLLEATWKLLRKRLSYEAFQETLQDQREWIRRSRDEHANRVAASEGLGAGPAFARATLERAGRLAAMIAVPPRSGFYASDGASFTASSNGSRVTIENGTGVGRNGNTCEFAGSGNAGDGWIRIGSEDESPGFFVLFTSQGAELWGYGADSYYCGMGAYFTGSYRRR